VTAQNLNQAMTLASGSILTGLFAPAVGSRPDIFALKKMFIQAAFSKASAAQSGWDDNPRLSAPRKVL
jgi:hypothetical protein